MTFENGTQSFSADAGPEILLKHKKSVSELIKNMTRFFILNQANSITHRYLIHSLKRRRIWILNLGSYLIKLWVKVNLLPLEGLNDLLISNLLD